MKTYLITATLAGWLLASSAMAADLTAAQVVERNAQARGGLAAWRAVTTLTLTGKMEAGGGANPELPFVMKMKRPHKSRLELTVKDQTAVQVYDGAKGAKFRPFLNRDDVEPYTPEEAKDAAQADELDGALIDADRKGIKVALAGREAVEGHDAYKLTLTSASGQKRHVWVDASTFLERKMDGSPRKIDGRMHPVSIYVRDYRKQDGLLVPSVIETQVEGVHGKPHKLTVEKIAINEPMDDGLFTEPRGDGAPKTASR